jgi:hypothetical protein
MGRGLMGTEAGASAQLCSQAGAWEQEATRFFSFDVQRSMFDVRCSTFIFKNNPTA